MKDKDKTKQQLINELEDMLRRFTESDRAFARTERRKRELEDAFVNMAINTVVTQEAFECYQRGHSERVAQLCRQISSKMSLSEEAVNRLETAARLHDLGRISIPKEILFKPAPLTLGEWAEVHLHPMQAVELLRPCDSLKEVLPIIESHHEHYDGGGYPNGLKGKQIPLASRILAVADAYDGMTSARPYRPSMTDEEAVEILRQGAGTQWDPIVVTAFLHTKGLSTALVIEMAS